MASNEATMLRINLDRSSPVPLYYQMAKAIEKDIESGTLAPGERLENEIALAGRYVAARQGLLTEDSVFTPTDDYREPRPGFWSRLFKRGRRADDNREGRVTPDLVGRQSRG